VLDAIHQLWLNFLHAIEGFVIPDWGALIGLIPYLLVIGVVGPILSLIVLGWVIYGLTAPRRKVVYAEGPLAAPIVNGEPVYPAGEPYCPYDGLIYPSGATNCERCQRELTLRCPRCDVGRPAHVLACGNCGLIVSVAKRDLTLRPAGPPPGGAASA
jgi:hypothetical protein